MLRVKVYMEFEKIENTAGLEHCSSPKVVCKPGSVLRMEIPGGSV